LYRELKLSEKTTHTDGDVCDGHNLREAVEAFAPEVVFHLAAQALVREGYRTPGTTFAVNVQGTVNVLEALRHRASPVAVVVVTSDKCYENDEAGRPFREEDRLGGNDPYSASKAAAELVVHAYRQSFFSSGTGAAVAVATARSGNVIGGGDWGADRLLPDLARAFAAGREMRIRNPDAIRPWQHVLDPLAGYLRLGAELSMPQGRAGVRSGFNFGPDASAAWSCRAVVEAARATWPGTVVVESRDDDDALKEASCLRLDNARAQRVLGWRPQWEVAEAIDRTVQWYRDFHDGTHSASALVERDFIAYESRLPNPSAA
jgi:CDP-glucose 4,6-dehydratase